MGKKRSFLQDPAALVPAVLEGDVRALARTLSLIADGTEAGQRAIELLYPHTGKAKVVGITGAPGAGKSTLVDMLALSLSERGARVAIIAVDPSSPFTQGAVLGDRIRMTRSAALEKVFIRSFASRGTLGGLAPRTAEAVFAFDAAGYDWVIIETVGVGQGEVEIVKNAQTVVLVLVPGMGDGVQALKAGIIEIADVFAINKSDYDGADQLERELLSVLALGPKEERTPRIVRTVATKGSGHEELLREIEAFHSWAKDSGAAKKKELAFFRQALENEIKSRALNQVLENAEKKQAFEAQLQALTERKETPAGAAKKLLSKA